ncbi:FUN14 family-domain-containing protein [Butyriboletus roseoflavus]|nr:FUN14 family-domain-containing protein [Butyriboletus roseoflavus]
MVSYVLRVGLRPCSAQFLRSSTAASKRHTSAAHFGTRLAVLRHTQRSLPSLLTATGIAGAALGISSSTTPSTLHYVPPSRASPSQFPPPPKSSVNAYELTFGTVCGLCAGVFAKKSARMVAFFFGGLFVVLQYLGSMSLVKVDWARMASGFENLFYTTDTLGNKRPPTAWSIWRWTVDFLTADFQPRASFVVGFALGLRVG